MKKDLPNGRSFHFGILAQGHYFLAVLGVQDLAHGAVDGGQAAEDRVVSGDILISTIRANM